MKKNPATPLALVATMLLITACGMDSVDNDPSPGSPQQGTSTDVPEPDNGSGATSPTVGMRGVVTVDGISYDITELRNCEPLSDGTVERALELQGIGEHEGERVQIDVYIQTLAGVPFNDVSWAGPEGVFGGADTPNVTLDAAGTSVRGAATLVDGLNQTETVGIDFELDVPAEIITCR